MNVLSGYKTYIAAGIAVLTAAATYADGTSTVAQAVQLGFTGVLAAFLRSGISSSK